MVFLQTLGWLSFFDSLQINGCQTLAYFLCFSSFVSPARLWKSSRSPEQKPSRHENRQPATDSKHPEQLQGSLTDQIYSVDWHCNRVKHIYMSKQPIAVRHVHLVMTAGTLARRKKEPARPSGEGWFSAIGSGARDRKAGPGSRMDVFVVVTL